MKRDRVFVKSRGQTAGLTPEGEILSVPLIPGLLKHLTLEQLEPLLQKPSVLEKYTKEALRWAPWSCLRDFPHHWLRQGNRSTLGGSRRRPGVRNLGVVNRLGKRSSGLDYEMLVQRPLNSFLPGRPCKTGG